MTTQLYWRCTQCMFIMHNMCAITIVLHAQAHNYRHPKYTWYYSVTHCVRPPCNHIQKRKITHLSCHYEVFFRKTHSLDSLALCTNDTWPFMEWSGNCNERLIRKRLGSYFHALLGLYVHFVMYILIKQLQDHVFWPVLYSKIFPCL